MNVTEQLKDFTVLVTAKFISFLFMLNIEDANLRGQRHKFQKNNMHKNEDAKKKRKRKEKQRRRMKAKTQNNASALRHKTKASRL